VPSSARRRTLVALAVVLAGAALIRGIDLERLPPGLFVDEAFTGYDAYSLLRTGRDMWGERLPVFFRSWGDYNSGLYRYLSLPWVAALGLSASAVRATAALAGVLTVLATYALGKRWFSGSVGIAAAAFLAVSPWHVQFSRIGFRGILLPLFLTLGALAFEQAVKRRGYWPALAALVFGVALYTYSPARIVVPLTLALLLILRRRELVWSRAAVLLSVAVLALMSVPLARAVIGGEGLERYHIMSIFRPETGGAEGLSVLPVFLRNYVSHFSPRFLLTAGDVNLRHSPSGIGQLNWGVFFLSLIGAAVALTKRGKHHVLLLLWVLVAPIPGSLTTDNVPNALRSIAMLPAAQLLAAVGLVETLKGEWAERLARARIRPAVVAGVLLALTALGAARSLSVYFTEYRIEAAPWWDYGYREAIAMAEDLRRDYERVAVLAPDKTAMRTYANNPYAFIFPLFYTAWDPARLQRERNTGRYAVLTQPPGGPVTEEMLRPGVLYILRAEQAVVDDPIAVVTYPSGRPAFILASRVPGGAPAP
jgi:4-amino-4-deoxy-L-arabinose transferase-like glycosyltransferase